jgi:GSH-dependent disulfide-bond oxidoreductase
MIDLLYYPSPNGVKIAIMLEECGLPFRVVPIDITRGEQFDPKFLAISPNNKIPAIVDHEPGGGEHGAVQPGAGPLAIFESGAILVYLAQKSRQFLPAQVHDRSRVLQWLFWQIGGLGPMAGQAHHFRAFATEQVPYGIKRYTDECNRLYGVLDRALAQREFVAGEYSIADMACWPWIRPHERQGQKLEDFPNILRWFHAVGERPGVQRGLVLGEERMADREAYKFLYGQTAEMIERQRRERT